MRGRDACLPGSGCQAGSKRDETVARAEPWSVREADGTQENAEGTFSESCEGSERAADSVWGGQGAGAAGHDVAREGCAGLVTFWNPKSERWRMFLCKENDREDPESSGRGVLEA